MMRYLWKLIDYYIISPISFRGTPIERSWYEYKEEPLQFECDDNLERMIRDRTKAAGRRQSN